MMSRSHGGPRPQNSKVQASRSGRRLRWLPGLAGALLLLPGVVWGGAHPSRGLWVGQVTLNFVNEVPVVLDATDQPVAPDPKIATPTSDEAHLRLILHVNGAGQVNLLRDVAILARSGVAVSSGQPVDVTKDPSALRYQADLLARESDLALVTDERLYGEFPPQPATRLASAVFDFGDARATEAVLAVIDAAAASAAASALAGKTAAEAEPLATAAANDVVQHSDVAAQFALFLSDSLKKSVVDSIANGDSTALADARAAAVALASWSSFFPDFRGSNMVEAVYQTTQTPGLTDEAKRQAAQNMAAAHADLTDEYARFLAGKEFGDMIAGGAAAAAAAAVVPGATAGSVMNAVKGNTAVRAAQTTANALAALSAYADTRAPDAVATVTAAIGSAAAGLLPAEPSAEASVKAAAEAAGRTALAEQVTRYAIPALGPTPDYTSFIKSAEFVGSPALAAKAAASAAVAAFAADPFLTLAELTTAGSDAATDALREGDANAFKAAAAAAERELPLAGLFARGVGDPRFSYAIKTENLAPLGAPALVGTLFLPASHPTNPFRHRKHPDHRYGYDIIRNIRLDFDAGPADSFEPAGFGVDRITGVYREELFGLHKKLGPGKDVGLRVEGRFELNRISLIDALNAR